MRFSAKLLMAACLAASLAAASGGAAAFDRASAFDGAVELGKVRPGTRSPGAAFGLPVDTDTLLATAPSAPSSAAGQNPAGSMPRATQSACASSLAPSIAPARVNVARMSGSGPAGLNATVSISLTATSMRDAAGHAVSLPASSGIVTVGYSAR